MCALHACQRVSLRASWLCTCREVKHPNPSQHNQPTQSALQRLIGNSMVRLWIKGSLGDPRSCKLASAEKLVIGYLYSGTFKPQFDFEWGERVRTCQRIGG